MKLPNLKFNFRGFTLIELMIAILIISIIATIGFTSYSTSQKIARDSRRKQDLRSIAVALELYYQKNKHYPCSIGRFAVSTKENWIEDDCINPKTTLATAYISAVPTDPLSNSGWTTPGYGYVYYADAWGVPAGQLYFLVTHLENSNDPETQKNRIAASKGYKDPAGSDFPTASYGNDSFFITSY